MMREQTDVSYILNLVDKEGNEIVRGFSHIFDSEIYYEDIDGTDILMVHHKVKDIQTELGEVFLLEFTVERNVKYLQ